MKYKIWDNRDKCWIEDSNLSNLLKPEFFFLNHIGELFYYNPAFFDRPGPEKCGDGEYTVVYSTEKRDSFQNELFNGDFIEAVVMIPREVGGTTWGKRVFIVGEMNEYLFASTHQNSTKIGNKFENPELMERA